ncbi:MAG: PAS domain S-box protein [bacterium]
MKRPDLEKSETNLQQLSGECLWSDTNPIGLAIVSHRNVLLHVNLALCRFLGYSKQELRGKTVRDITHPDEWNNSAKKIRLLHSSGQTYSRFEKRFLRKNGTTAWGEVNSSLIGDRSLTQQFRVTQVVDINRRKDSDAELRLGNERFRIALDGSPTVVFSQDRKLRYTWIYNLGPAFKIEDFIGKRDCDIFTPSEAIRFTRIKRNVMKTGAGHREEVSIQMPGGKTFHDTITEPLRNESGKIIGVICAVVDITQRKRMEAILKQTNEELEQKVKDRTAQLRQLTEELVRAEHRERRRIADILHEHLQQQLCGMKFRTCHLKAGSAEPATVGLADKLISDLDQAIQLTRSLSSNLYPPVLSLSKVKGFIEWIAADAMSSYGLTVKIKVDSRLELRSQELRMFVFDSIRELLLNANGASGFVGGFFIEQERG